VEVRVVEFVDNFSDQVEMFSLEAFVEFPLSVGRRGWQPVQFSFDQVHFVSGLRVGIVVSLVRDFFQDLLLGYSKIAFEVFDYVSVDASLGRQFS
jgi:hypothetical protein